MKTKKTYEDEKTFNDIKNLFRLEKWLNYIVIKDLQYNIYSNNYIKYEGSSDRNKTLSIEEYLNKIGPYFKDIILNLKKYGTWKIQLTIAINFIIFIDNERVMDSQSDNREIMIYDEPDEVIKELFDSLKNRYQINLELMKGSDFVFDYFHLLYYNCYKINQNCGGSYIDSPDWIKNKKATMNLIKKKDNKFFQYTVTVALNYEEIKKTRKE